MRLLNFTVSLTAVLAIAISAAALDVDTKELSKAKKVDFQNYTGGERTNPDLAEVDKIGRTLANGTRQTGYGRFLLKYSVTRAHSDEAGKISADIFSIDKDARVNHVRMIRTILASYYRNRFGYTVKEANILASVTTYYNAAYRGDVSYLSTVYRSVVMSKVNASNAGLSTKYFEWPGKSKILIPLGEDGKRADIFSLADEKTTDEMRKQPDKSLSDRKEIIKMKEKEVEKEKVGNEKKAADVEKKKEDIAKKEDANKEKKAAVAEEKKQNTDEKKKAEAIKDPNERAKAKEDVARKEQKTAEKEKETVKKDEEIKKEKDKVALEEKAVEKKKEETAKKEDSVEKDKESVKRDDTGATKDSSVSEKKPGTPLTREEAEKKSADLDKREKDIEKKKEEVAAKIDKVFKEKLYYLKVNNWFNDGIYNNEMYIINPLTRKVILKSPYNTIAGRKFDIYAKGVVVIGFEGRSGANFDHRLVVLDPDKLTALRTGTDIIFWRSFVEIRDNFIYCVLSDKGKYLLARYDEQLARKGESKVEVDKDSTISFYDKFIYITAPDKRILVLNKDDLSFIEAIDPAKDIDKE